jgi:hypothetical protein
MTRATTFLLVWSSMVSACPDYSVWDRGIWPRSWPAELDPLREQARTFEGPFLPERRYLIPFSERAEFEAAWPHLLRVKSEGAPIILVRGPRTDFFEIKPAGVLIKCPPEGSDNPESPLSGDLDVRTRWRNASYIELVVDGSVVDLNRIRLPADTPIVDERFEAGSGSLLPR